MNKNIFRYIIGILYFIIFASCEKTNTNLFPVSDNRGKYGYIDSTGKLLIDYQFDFAHPFYEQIALVLKDSNIFYIDKKGKETIKAQIEPVTIICVKENSNATSKVTSKVTYGVPIDDMYVKDITFDVNTFRDLSFCYFFCENRAAYFDKKKGLYGFINEKGEIVIQPRFKKVNQFREGLAAVQFYDSTKSRIDDLISVNSNWGYINKKGEVIVNPIYFRASDFSNGKAFINIKANNPNDKNGNYSLSTDGFFIDKNGRIISENFANTFCFANPFGTYRIAYNFVDNLITGRGYYFLDSLNNHYPINDGEELSFEDVTNFSEGLAGIKARDVWYIIDENLNFLIDQKFEDVKRCNEGMIQVKKNGIWKYLNTQGLYPFKQEFDSCGKFENGLAYVETSSINSKIKGYIDKKGNYVWQMIQINENVKDFH